MRPLWVPSEARVRSARITDYLQWLARTRVLAFGTYEDLWQWSSTELDAFWSSVATYFDVPMSGSRGPVLAGGTMPGARWFPEVRLNYAEQVFRHASDAGPAVLAGDEAGSLEELPWKELQRRVAALAGTLRASGIGRGDRV